jgi:hypothetical protein
MVPVVEPAITIAFFQLWVWVLGSEYSLRMKKKLYNNVIVIGLKNYAVKPVYKTILGILKLWPLLKSGHCSKV